MQVFELHFNPRAKKETFFETFYWEPENFYENRLGSLFSAGELKNTLSANERFLNNLARVLKTEFYNSKINKPEKALKKSLKEANEFLETIIKNGEVSWLSNLNFAILTITPYPPSPDLQEREKKYKLNFTKIGDIEIVLIRAEQILNLGKKLELEEIEPYPLKVFSKIVAGKLKQNDKILILSQGVFKSFRHQNFIEKIAQLGSITEKALSAALKDIGKTVSGVCLLIDLAEQEKKEQERKIVFKEKPLNKKMAEFVSKANLFYSKMHKIFLRVRAFLKKIKKLIRPKIELFLSWFKKLIFKIHIPAFDALKLRLPHIILPSGKAEQGLDSLPHIKIPKRVPREQNAEQKEQKDWRKEIVVFAKTKKFSLILGLIALLLLGSFLANTEDKRTIRKIESEFMTVKEKTATAKAYYISDKKEQARLLFLETWGQIQPLAKIDCYLSDDINSAKKEIEINLSSIYELKEIKEPELFFEFQKQEPLPQKIIYSNGKVYCFSPLSKELTILNQGNAEHFKGDFNLTNGTIVTDGLLFYSKPDKFILFDNDWNKSFDLESYSTSSDFNYLSSFNSNLYSWDEKSGQIIKNQYLAQNQWDKSRVWLKNSIDQEKANKAQSMAIDGGVWILNKNGSIDYYLNRELEKTINPDVFPEFKSPTKIWTNSATSYLYILEPEQKRIVVIDKFSDKVIRQYRSESFEALKSISVSSDGTDIYALSGLKIYKIKNW